MNNGAGFASIGTEDAAFSGRFDGLGFDIFDLNINRTSDKYVGLFGNAYRAIIRNFTLNSGTILGGDYTGAAVGNINNGIVENIINTADVKGNNHTGGIVGSAQSSELSDLINVGTITSDGKENLGGIVGFISSNSHVRGDTYNLGAVAGENTKNVGGIVGKAENSTIGNEEENAFKIYNQLNVTGGTNVGGIVGYISKSSVTNAANYGTILAKSYETEKYNYHTTRVNFNENGTYGTSTNGSVASIDAYVANVGGIVGFSTGDAENKSKISNVENSGDIKTSEKQGSTSGISYNYFESGNVGGIVGKAENTDIINAQNKENDIRGAHNVGGIAGYITGNSTVDLGINNGGDVSATGARNNNGFVREHVRNSSQDKEAFIVGNIGGIVGYLYGDDVKVSNSANRGSVHSAYIENQNAIPETAKAANVGGIVGKISTSILGEENILNAIKADSSSATVSGSYNTGDVQGYTGVGGIVGMMYNGSVAKSYNLGTLKATRQATAGTIEALNMGGIVGDTTEEAGAMSVIYDVYNSGVIGDEEFNFYGRHVGGIVGRLSGHVDKAYNTGEIYNGYSTVGGIAGWWYDGTVKNVFNTGNITVVNYDTENNRSQVGGIIGDAGKDADSLSYAYNLGIIRSFIPNGTAYLGDNQGHYIGGIAGRTDGLSISNVYTVGTIYGGREQSNGTYSSTNGNYHIGAIVGGGSANISFANYILPQSNTGFTALMNVGEISGGVKAIAYDNRYNSKEYLGFSINNDIENTEGEVDDWRIYEGSTPILNAFIPESAKNENSWNNYEGLDIQYGTAYNPLLTIIDVENSSNKDLAFDWKTLGISGAAGLVVYNNNSLVLNGFTTAQGQFFGGTIYSDGSLTINGASQNSNFSLGSASNLYGTSVILTSTSSDITVNGKITSTDGDITITAGNEDSDTNSYDIEIIGKLCSSQNGKNITISGISSNPFDMNVNGLNDPLSKMQTISERFTFTTETASKDGNITLSASGNADILYGHLETGGLSLGASGSLTISGNSGVYVDSDVSAVNGNIALNSSKGEVLFDITNTAATGTDNLFKFLDNHNKSGNNIILNGFDGNNKITIDMWSNEQNSYDLNKFDVGIQTLVSKLNSLNIKDGSGKDLEGQEATYIWVSSAEQLQGIQEYYKQHPDSNILSYNFALKNDIDASTLNNYEAIGTGSDGYSGAFDGRDYRIVGLTVGSDSAENTDENVGIFHTISAEGKVNNLRVYGSKFYGKDYAGAIAGINNGLISGVTTLGNHVEVFGSLTSMSVAEKDHVGIAGGIAGLNNGTIKNISASDSVVAGDNGNSDEILTTAGGIVGVNAENAIIGGEKDNDHVLADSAVTANESSTLGLGGIAGVNLGDMQLITNTGVTHGKYGDNITSNNVGGIVGINRGEIVSAYNGSDVTGGDNVGGIGGDNSGSITNAINAGDILANFVKEDGTNYKYSGGLIGKNSGSINSGRNTGEIFGGNYVGGLVGANAENATLQNLSNSVFAYIYGSEYVGGIAGSNAGSISADESNLENYGQIFGQKYVGGIAGQNEATGEIKNTVSSISLNIKDTSQLAEYFGGVVGLNAGTIDGATNTNDVIAEDANYVGGIIGHNTTGQLKGEIKNEGEVSGNSSVGGIIGKNENDNVLQGTADNRLIVSNSGDVLANDGGAAGIFYENDGMISYADISNSGKITGGKDTNGVTGGLFGINTGDIKYSTLTNSGTVSGGGTVGGLIGQNEGKVEFSSLINTVDSDVSGGSNVGGLIGINSGDIIGGRLDESKNDAGYYKYQIYNNGTVKGTENVGGLIGKNESGANLVAAYNTGTVFGSGDSVGGIAGWNAGVVDQVFNTIIIADGGSGAIIGANNVGGIIGTNSGKLSNAYNTSSVNGNLAVGQITGSNSGNVSLTYASGQGDLIGNGSQASQSYANMDGKYSDSDYSGFDFGNTWKIYEGNSSPLLKVFLTKLNINDTNDEGIKLSDYLQLVYNAKEQDINIADLIEKGFITGPDGWEDAFLAYKNTQDENSQNGDSSLLYNTTGQKNAGTYHNWLASNQIAYGNGTPNNLGYDIDLGELNVDKATLEITLNDIWREYGNGQMYSDDAMKDAISEYLYTIAGADADMLDELENLLSFDKVTDAAVDNLLDGKTTNDVGAYKLSIHFKVNSDNYQFDNGKDETTIESNVSHVIPTSLTISLGDVNRVYGNVNIIGEDYAITNSSGLTNGDVLLINKDNIKDNGLRDSSHTENAGDYTWTINKDGLDGINLDNYKIIFQNADGTTSEEGFGKSTITKADLSIVVDDASTSVGVLPEFSGTDINNSLVNEDSLEHSYSYGIGNESLINNEGSYSNVIGIFVDGRFYGDADQVNWSDVDSVFKNYNVSYSLGTLTVSKASEPKPEPTPSPALPEINLRSPYGHVYQEGWGWKRNFRERKAEVHFEDGGVKTPQSL